jgi:hypothetical protein
MELLGKRNWFLPRSLNWLPRIGGKTHAEAGPAKA